MRVPRSATPIAFPLSNSNAFALCISSSSGVNRGPRRTIETDVNTIFRLITEICGVYATAIHGPDKPGEQKRSVLDISHAKLKLGWEPQVAFTEGLRSSIEWFIENNRSLPLILDKLPTTVSVR